MLAALLLPYWLISQTCCSGGVPLANNLGLPNEGSGSWQLGVSYDYNNLHTLLAGKDPLNDQARQRQTHSFLLNFGYAINSSWSVEALFTWVNQSRVIRQFENRQVTETQGLGDAVFLVKYALNNVLGPNSGMGLGIGTKAPLGQADLTTDEGIQITADLQPGSGAWDFIGWASLFKTSPWRPTGTLSLGLLYRATGVNNDYLNGLASYEFGNDLQINAGYLDQFLLFDTVLMQPGVVFRYRKARGDQIDQQEIPNTGGEWIFMRPEVGISLSKQLKWVNQLEFPLYSYVDGTQLTPTLRFTTLLRFSFIPRRISLQNNPL